MQDSWEQEPVLLFDRYKNKWQADQRNKVGSEGAHKHESEFPNFSKWFLYTPGRPFEVLLEDEPSGIRGKQEEHYALLGRVNAQLEIETSRGFA